MVERRDNSSTLRRSSTLRHRSTVSPNMGDKGRGSKVIGVAVRNPQGREIGNQARGVVEGELGAELQTIRRQRNPGRPASSPRLFGRQGEPEGIGQRPQRLARLRVVAPEREEPVLRLPELEVEPEPL